MRIRATATVLFLSSLLVSSPALAQQRHVVSPGQIREAMSAQVNADQQTRDMLRGVLKNSQVRDVAERLGLNVASAEGAVATLTTDELETLAGPVRNVDTQLAGGSNTVIVSTTTVLLIIIIVILLSN